ncbi:MMPL family transporter [Mycetocola tolaasinivorans]|uniref:MMPL family transporter n=1 Tax=Mycetocola tolaasinivorans TaxID=76635 RepID=UPI001C7D91DA|nr:MMPL family transporter [Mycetocola tolaasinivorans]
MSSLLYSLGRWAYGARKLVLGIWIVILALFGVGAGLFGQGTENSFSIPGTESQVALDSLKTTFPQISGASGQIVVVSGDAQKVDDPAIKKSVEDAVAALTKINGIEGAVSPFDATVKGNIADNDRAALISIQFSGTALEVKEKTIDGVKDALADLKKELPSGADASLGGDVFNAEVPGVTLTEAIGVIVALIVLLFTFGSVIAAGMPLLNALMGVGVSALAIMFVTVFGSVPSTTLMLALMLGLAVGIDYALFILARHTEQLARGMEPRESAARAIATAGSAVVFAGLTVMIALVGLFVAGIPFLTTMGIGAAASVFVAVLISLTLMPAMLGFAGERLRPKVGTRAERRALKNAARTEKRAARSRRGTNESLPAVPPAPAAPAHAAAHASAPVAEAHPEPKPNRFFLGWVRAVTRFPLVTIIIVVVGLGAAALPGLNLRLALPDAGSHAPGSESRETYDRIAENFGAGFNGPLIVTGTIVKSTDPLKLMDDIADEIRDLPGVKSVPVATPNASADTGFVQVIPTDGPNSEQTQELVAKIRSLHDHFEKKYGVSLSVTGYTAMAIDVSSMLGGALLPFGLLVVGLSLVLLTMVFRSIWVPVKATLGYLLSVGVSFGVVAAVFELGWGAELFNVHQTGPVISFMPILLMGVLFGLAMDYEVFLVARMREEYVHGATAKQAIERGFTGSAKVVTAAAIIMIAVFAAFIPEGDNNIKPIALGLAVGVAVDAFIVRMMLVPAVLALLGDRAWKMPRWLDRVLPSFDVEGEGLAHEIKLRDWPEPGNTDAIVGADLRPAGPGFAPVGVSVRPGEVLVVTGPNDAVATTLLTLTGRHELTEGILKVTGRVLPTHAGAIRRRAAWVDITHTSERAFEALLAESPRVLAIDGVDRLDAATRTRLRERLERARAAAGTERPLTIILGTTDSSLAAECVAATTPLVTLTLSTVESEVLV